MEDYRSDKDNNPFHYEDSSDEHYSQEANEPIESSGTFRLCNIWVIAVVNVVVQDSVFLL